MAVQEAAIPTAAQPGKTQRFAVSHLGKAFQSPQRRAAPRTVAAGAAASVAS